MRNFFYKKMRRVTGEQVYKLNVPEPKTDNEAVKKGRSKAKRTSKGRHKWQLDMCWARATSWWKT